MARPRTVVIFDIGGVIADSPIQAIRRFCRAAGIADLNPFLGRSTAWDAFMRGRLKPADFPKAAYEECIASDYKDGVGLGARGWGKMLDSMASSGYRPLMIRTLRRLRSAGFKLVALTNNYDTEPLPDAEEQARADAEHKKFVGLFDHFVESRVVGLSKPDRRFYEYALKEAGCSPSDAIFLDDIGANLKTAKGMGIHTILVRNDTDTSFHDAVGELQAQTGVELIDR
eukprot:CAMPEP_0204573720 /NCGR_PEP_ID=MMETSP0661-20131031/40187_1 /ASSEMBLY_ACC=CAM_ASM_000606 /TAXON_ID=109239 /ORGANISM="Alexandrium margalefi, Strain AMGDE01CS-322" /LENGTH=227 /DNA_ID=CAMNT_0051582177 /DNA_START=39 /DNA_END=718 /DNA_ORIENTATION=+